MPRLIWRAPAPRPALQRQKGGVAPRARSQRLLGMRACGGGGRGAAGGGQRLPATRGCGAPEPRGGGGAPKRLPATTASVASSGRWGRRPCWAPPQLDGAWRDAAA